MKDKLIAMSETTKSEKFKLYHISAGYVTSLILLTGVFVSWKLATLYFIGVYLLAKYIHSQYKIDYSDEKLGRRSPKMGE